jgi:hypothetical protein
VIYCAVFQWKSCTKGGRGLHDEEYREKKLDKMEEEMKRKRFGEIEKE